MSSFHFRTIASARKKLRSGFTQARASPFRWLLVHKSWAQAWCPVGGKSPLFAGIFPPISRGCSTFYPPVPLRMLRYGLFSVGLRGISKVQKVSVFCLWMFLGNVGIWQDHWTMIFPLDRNLSGESGETCGDLAGPGLGAQLTSLMLLPHWERTWNWKCNAIDSRRGVIHGYTNFTPSTNIFNFDILRCLTSLNSIPLQKSSNLASQNSRKITPIFLGKTLVSHLHSPNGHWRWVMELLPKRLSISSGRSFKLYL